jgi:hypothetical protein
LIEIRDIALQHPVASDISLPKPATSSNRVPPYPKKKREDETCLKLLHRDGFACYSSSWLRRRALPFVTETFSWAARSTIAFLFSVETLCAISALYFLQSGTGKQKGLLLSITYCA